MIQNKNLYERAKKRSMLYIKNHQLIARVQLLKDIKNWVVLMKIPINPKIPAYQDGSEKNGLMLIPIKAKIHIRYLDQQYELLKILL